MNQVNFSLNKGLCVFHLCVSKKEWTNKTRNFQPWAKGSPHRFDLSLVVANGTPSNPVSGHSPRVAHFIDQAASSATRRNTALRTFECVGQWGAVRILFERNAQKRVTNKQWSNIHHTEELSQLHFCFACAFLVWCRMEIGMREHLPQYQ